ncbi:MAG: lysylphosphatidylglycerol synthase transmembrane domain-containing protein [Pseudomonadota bacterium]|nr:lysylphosphatidylglycerol synthase transmembrane domain-containing protein [Pseudomonadota bacterium]
MPSRWLFAIIKFVISVALIGFIAWNFEIGDAIGRLKGLLPGPIFLATAVFVLLFFNNTFRWLAVMTAINSKLSFWESFRILYIGVFFNQTLPSSVGGDAVRMYLSRRAGLPLIGAINGVMLERVATIIGLILLVIITQPFLFERIGDNPIKYIFPILAGVVLIGISCLMVLDKLPQKLRKHSIFNGVAKLAVDTRSLFFSPFWALLSLGLGITGNILLALAAYLVFSSLSIDVGLVDCLILMPPVILVTTIPLSIAGWGLREGAMISAFAFVGVVQGDAFVASILFGLVGIAVSLPGGVVWMFTGYKRKDIEEEIFVDKVIR